MHWLANAAVRAGITGAEALSIPGNVTRAVAWDTACRVLGVPDRELAFFLAPACGVRPADLDGAETRFLKLLPEKIARRYHVVPIRDDGHTLIVATSDPTDLATEQAVSFATGRRAVFELASPKAIGEAIDAGYAPDRSIDTLLSSLDAEIAAAVRVVEDISPEVVREKDVQAAPVVRLTNLLLREAVVSRASDVHLEPGPGGGTVRFRIDGVMHVHMQIPMAALNRVVSRIKVLSRLDIADRTRPQDGRTRVSVDGKTFDLRVSTVPTRESEKAVIRILRPDTVRTLDDAGLGDQERRQLRQLLTHREGIVLVTGPTGSGKTTTLYAALREVAEQHVNIITVEDPIEYELTGTTQVQVDAKRGITFASALRAILRQDPDVIFIGEIRDLETAEIAAHSALTGHLVLATLHANDAMGAVARLVDIGLDRASIAASLRGSVAQRLVRKICGDCAVPVSGALTPEERRLAGVFNVAPTRRAVGCPACGGTGYRGRLPIAEIGAMSAAVAERIVAGASAGALQSSAVAGGMRTLRDVALDRVTEGLTTLQEVARVVGEAGETAPATEVGTPPAASRSERRVGATESAADGVDNRRWRSRDRRGRFRRGDDARGSEVVAEETVSAPFSVDRQLYLREVRAQCACAVNAVISLKSVLAQAPITVARTDDPREARHGEVFRACQSFLSHASMVSRLLWPAAPRRRAAESREAFRQRCAADPRLRRATDLRLALDLPAGGHVLRQRRIREYLAGYDESFDQWQSASTGGATILEHVGPHPDGVAASGILRWYDPATGVVRFRGAEFDIISLVRGVQSVQHRVDAALGSAVQAPRSG